MIKEYQIIIAGALIGIGLYFGLKEMKPDRRPTPYEECLSMYESRTDLKPHNQNTRIMFCIDYIDR